MMVTVYEIGRKPGIGTKGCHVLARTYSSKTNENMAIFYLLRQSKMMLTSYVVDNID